MLLRAEKHGPAVTKEILCSESGNEDVDVSTLIIEIYLFVFFQERHCSKE